MRNRPPSCLAAVLLAHAAFGQSPPADTYFSMAVTENSHNHVGARRLFLDFQAPPFVASGGGLGVVVSTQATPGQVVLDGDDSEWDPALLSVVSGLAQNNYPLSEFIDAVRTNITVGSAWDADNVYFLVQWEDAGHDASARIKKWINGDQGGGEAGWNSQLHVGATVGAPNEAAVNSSGHVLAGAESEDRVFFMFPIVDVQGVFTRGGAGCAYYCHPNLSDDFPFQNYTGTGVAAMHTSVPGDTADIWHWKSSRTQPSGYADDKYIEFAIGSTNGRKSDAGTAAYSDNGLSGPDPTLMHTSGLSYTGDVLFSADAVPFAGTPAPGDEIPRYVSVQPTGSRGDVRSAAVYDPLTRRWTVEFQRLRDTGNTDDHSFEGTDATPPGTPLVTSVDPVAGAQLYSSKCQNCHQAEGAGTPMLTTWLFPRVQRASGSLILHAIDTVPFMGSLAGQLSEQDVEDVAAYLQTQAIFAPVQAFGAACGGLTTRWLGSPTLGSTDFEVTLAGAAPSTPALLLAGFSNTSWVGIPLPLVLDTYGLPGCSLLVSVNAETPVATDPTGKITLPVPIGTDPALIGAVVYTQWVVAVPSPAFSDALAITLQP